MRCIVLVILGVISVWNDGWEKKIETTIVSWLVAVSSNAGLDGCLVAAAAGVAVAVAATVALPCRDSANMRLVMAIIGHGAGVSCNSCRS